MKRSLAVLAIVLTLAACGVRRDLKPAVGKELPVAPYGREERPNPEVLMAPPQQAMPERSVELRKRSVERADDPFDLPPAE